MIIIDEPPYLGTDEADNIFVHRQPGAVTAGGGDDVVTWQAQRYDTLTVDLGAGDDVFNVIQFITRNNTQRPLKMTVDGGDGDDVIFGTISRDHIIGGDGDDFLYSDPEGYVYRPHTSPDIDLIEGGGGNDVIFGHGKMYGGDGDDVLVMTGNKGATTVMDGGAGNDYIDASGHRNVKVYGGEGADIFVANGGTIYDFNPAEGDRLKLPLAVTSISREFDDTPGHLWIRIYPRSGVMKIYQTDADGEAQLLSHLPRVYPYGAIDWLHPDVSWFL